jgi:hypothetical protein
MLSPTTSGVQLRPRSQGRLYLTSPREDFCATSVGAGLDYYPTWTTSCSWTTCVKQNYSHATASRRCYTNSASNRAPRKAYGNPRKWVTTSASRSASRTASFEPHRQNADLLQISFNTTRPRSKQRPLATRQTTSRFRKEGAVLLPRYRAIAFLSTRTPLRVEFATRMGRPGTHDTLVIARPRMVADSARPTQRTLNLQTHRDGIPPRGLKCLRVGSRVERHYDNPNFQARGF